MFKVPEKFRVITGPVATSIDDGNNGMFVIPRSNGSKISLIVIASDGAGWDHVSVSMKDRMPTWDDMCLVKRLFWAPDALVVQYHVPEAKNINNHHFCLHLWRAQDAAVPVPPSWMVGFKGATHHG